MYDLLDMTCLPVDVIMKMNTTFPVAGDQIFSLEDMQLEPGGSGNLFVLFTRLGGTVLPVAPIGDDIYGKWMKDVYEEIGIETKGLILTEGYRTQVAHCLVDTNGVHTFLNTLPSVEYGTEEQIRALTDECKSFYLSGYSLAGDKHLVMIQRCVDTVRRLYQEGKSVFFDSGPRVKDIDPAILNEIVEKSQIVCLNHQEAYAFTGCDEVEKAAQKISEKTKGMVVVKDGANGCYVNKEDSKKWYPGFKVKKVDTIGAGDSFFSAMIYGYLNDWDMDDMVIVANAAGAMKTSKAGSGRNVPTPKEIQNLLKENGYMWIQEGTKVILQKEDM